MRWSKQPVAWTAFGAVVLELVVLVLDLPPKVDAAAGAVILAGGALVVWPRVTPMVTHDAELEREVVAGEARARRDEARRGEMVVEALAAHDEQLAELAPLAVEARALELAAERAVAAPAPTLSDVDRRRWIWLGDNADEAVAYMTAGSPIGDGTRENARRTVAELRLDDAPLEALASELVANYRAEQPDADLDVAQALVGLRLLLEED